MTTPSAAASATQTGKEMQFFGARANLAKCLLYAINGGVDEKSHEQCGPNYAPITGEYLNYDEVLPKYVQMLDWLAGLYVNVLNLIQYMHDKYYYEEAEMALIDTDVRRTFATGIAGFSHVIDSLSAIKYAKVKAVRDENGLATGFEVEGDFPKYGNDDDRADEIGVWLLKTFLEMIKKRHTYRNSEATTSILTITSNVVYGKYTGALPDGRAAFTPFAPGANPSYGAEQNGLLASLNSVAKLPYHWALDGISNTQTINPDALGHSEGEIEFLLTFFAKKRWENSKQKMYNKVACGCGCRPFYMAYQSGQPTYFCALWEWLPRSGWGGERSWFICQLLLRRTNTKNNGGNLCPKLGLHPPLSETFGLVDGPGVRQVVLYAGLQPCAASTAITPRDLGLLPRTTPKTPQGPSPAACRYPQLVAQQRRHLPQRRRAPPPAGFRQPFRPPHADFRCRPPWTPARPTRRPMTPNGWPVLTTAGQHRPVILEFKEIDDEKHKS